MYSLQIAPWFLILIYGVIGINLSICLTYIVKLHKKIKKLKQDHERQILQLKKDLARVQGLTDQLPTTLKSFKQGYNTLKGNLDSLTTQVQKMEKKIPIDHGILIKGLEKLRTNLVSITSVVKQLNKR